MRLPRHHTSGPFVRGERFNALVDFVIELSRQVLVDAGAGLEVVPLTVGRGVALTEQDEPTADWFPAMITGASKDGSNWRWSYTFVEVEKTGPGYETDAWTAVEGGRSGTAYNGIESPNGASGLLGNGVDTANLLGTFEPQPCPAGVIVFIHEVDFIGDEPATEYWFTYANGTDGECPEEEGS